MKATEVLGTAACLLVGWATPFVSQVAAAVSSDGAVGITAVSSRVSKDYVRTKLPDGSFKPEEYAFGDGGRFDGTFRDATVDKLTFLDVAGVIAVPLAAQNYHPAKDIKSEKLLIIIHWGTTNVSDWDSTTPGSLSYQNAENKAGEFGSNSPQSKAALGLAEMQLSTENLQRNHTDFMNAQMLGYDSEDLIGTYYGSTVGNTGFLATHRHELIDEIEERRYFVVLIAYDFQAYLKKKKLTALWETRFSINEPRNEFNKALPVMAQYASRFFGQDSHGLLRTRVPDGQVTVGATKSIGEADSREK